LDDRGGPVRRTGPPCRLTACFSTVLSGEHPTRRANPRTAARFQGSPAALPVGDAVILQQLHDRLGGAESSGVRRHGIAQLLGRIPPHALRVSTAYADVMPAETIAVADAREMWLLGDIVIDVRTPAEYANSHIAGAVNIPLDALLAALEQLPSGNVITTCSMGGRAGRAATMLALAGRTAFTIDGGTKAWQSAGLPLATGPEPGGHRRKRTWSRRA
jgi:rhodanese-related sulfurtransferase